MSDSFGGQTLAQLLSALRAVSGLSLREVEKASSKVVSNAYLSQLENGKVAKPSPNILHALAHVYGVPYEDLMGRAGYLSSNRLVASAGAEDNPALLESTAGEIFSISHVSPEEKQALFDYLAFLRHKKKRPY
ncbi:MAG: helix-turn-helix domain-containing protein [Moraxellaceae bacterium]